MRFRLERSLQEKTQERERHEDGRVSQCFTVFHSVSRLQMYSLVQHVLRLTEQETCKHRAAETNMKKTDMEGTK